MVTNIRPRIHTRTRVSCSVRNVVGSTVTIIIAGIIRLYHQRYVGQNILIALMDTSSLMKHVFLILMVGAVVGYARMNARRYMPENTLSTCTRVA